MTNDERIAELLATPPKVRLRGWQRVEWVVGWVTAVFSVASLIGVGILAAASVTTSTCINTNLGQRNQPSLSDAQAHIAFAKALDAVLVAPAGPAQTAAFIQFEKQTSVYVSVLQADQVYRNAHPLGRC